MSEFLERFKANDELNKAMKEIRFMERQVSKLSDERYELREKNASQRKVIEGLEARVAEFEKPVGDEKLQKAVMCVKFGRPCKERMRLGECDHSLDLCYAYCDSQARVRELSQDFLTVIELLDRNTGNSYPMDPDTAVCYYCEDGIPPGDWCHDDAPDHLESWRGHKIDCAWRQAREMLDEKENNKKLAASAPSGDGEGV